MFRSLTVENFRCFRRLELPALDRVNLIAGMNNTGKTALLEAICCLGYGDLGVVPHLNHARGVDGEKSSTEDVCLWLFRDRDPKQEILLAGTNEYSNASSLQIKLIKGAGEKIGNLLKQAQTLLVLDPKSPQFAIMLYARFQPFSGEPTERLYLLSEKHLQPIPDYTGDRRRCAFLGRNTDVFFDALTAFSEMESKNRQEELLISLRLLEPRLGRLALLIEAGQPILHGDVGLPRLVPITIMGEGVRRLVSILLAILNTSGGLVFIDEIENGLHYSVMTKVWQAIASAAEAANAQVFATTHSYECIQYAHQAFAGRPAYDLRLVRLDRTNGDIRAVTYDQRSLETSIDMSYEVR